jgi:hypothetical protein
MHEQGEPRFGVLQPPQESKEWRLPNTHDSPNVSKYSLHGRWSQTQCGYIFILNKTCYKWRIHEVFILLRSLQVGWKFMKHPAYVSMSRRQVFGVGSEGMQVDKINLKRTWGTRFRLIWALRRVITLRPVWLYWCWFADCFSLYFCYIFYCPRWGSTLSIYSRGTASYSLAGS